MDPVTLLAIIATVVTPVLKRLSDGLVDKVVDQTISSFSDTFLSLIKQKSPSVIEALDNLKKEPGSERSRDVLKKALASSGATEDVQIRELAVKILPWIRPMPAKPGFFVGRQGVRDKIKLSLKEKNIICLLGMGGIGKTALAIQIATEMDTEFPGGVFWIDNLSLENNHEAVLRKWGRLCGDENIDREKAENLPLTVRSLLQSWQTMVGSILFVLDDVPANWSGIPEIIKALPICASLLITTRQLEIAQEADAQIFNLDALSQGESRELLVCYPNSKLTGAEADEIAGLCGYMPLALVLMAKLSRENGKNRYLKRLRSEITRLETLELDDASRKEQSVNLTIKISYQALLDKKHTESARLFRYFGAFGQPASISFAHLVDSLLETRALKSVGEDPGEPTPQAKDDQAYLQSQSSQDDYEEAVFVSYAWGGASEKTVDELEQAFAEHGLRVIRDKKDLAYRGSIKEFEQRIGHGQCIVLVISDKYLRSKHCMYELVEIEKNKNLRKRIFPIVLADALIYEPIDRLVYRKYWDEQIKELNQAIKQQVEVMTNLTGVSSSLDTYDRIRDSLDHLTELLSDMNALTPQMHEASGFSTLIAAVKASMPGKSPALKPVKSSAQLQPVTDQEDAETYRIFVEDSLQRLENWSLLAPDDENDEFEMFSLHLLLHDYARSLLKAPTEKDAAFQVHLHYCVAFANANPDMNLQVLGKNTRVFEKAYTQMRYTLRQVKERYLANGMDWESDPVLARQIVTLVSVLDHYWQWQSLFAEQAEWLATGFDCAAALGDPLKQADFARRLGRVLSLQVKLKEALQWMKKCKAALGKDKSPKAQAIRALMYIHLASIEYQKGKLEVAGQDCLLGLALADKDQAPAVYAEGKNLLGAVHLALGDFDLAIEAFTESISGWEQVGNRYQVTRVSDNLSTVYYYQGLLPEARTAGEKNLSYWKERPESQELVNALSNQGLVFQRLGESQTAYDLHRQAMEISDRLAIGQRVGTRNNLAEACISLGRYDEAEHLLNTGLKMETESGNHEYWVALHCSLAEVAYGRKDYQSARERGEKALALALEEQDPLSKGEALRVLGQICHATGELEQAKEHLEAGLSQMRADDLKYESYRVLRVLARLYADLKDDEKAPAAAEEARKLAKEMGISFSSDIPGI